MRSTHLKTLHSKPDPIKYIIMLQPQEDQIIKWKHFIKVFIESKLKKKKKRKEKKTV